MRELNNEEDSFNIACLVNNTMKDK